MNGTEALVFLIQVILGLPILAVMLRFLLQLTGADFYNPVSQFLVKVTSPILGPLRKVIPPVGKFDIASVVVMVVLQIALIYIILSLGSPVDASIVQVLILAFKELIGLAINVFLFSILILVIISWINPGQYNPVVSLLYGLTDPLVGPVRKALPPMGGFDFSPLVVLIGLQLVKILFGL